MDSFLEAHDIVKRYSSHTALAGVSIDVKRGRIFGLLGPNGAGKTTLIRIINRITMPDEGRIVFDGRPMEERDVYRIGYLPEERGLYKKMKVGEQAIYLARLKGLDKRTAEIRLRQWFNKFEITPWWGKKVEELSKGMQQKVQFITTVLHEPELMIFDEPFSGFDPINAELLKKEILEFKEKGHTIVFSTHNMNSVEEICDDIALINHSQVVLSGRVCDVRKQYRTGIYKLTVGSGTALVSNDDYEVLTVDVREDSADYQLRKKNDAMTNSEFVSLLAKQADLISFEEYMPSMNEIFIKVAGHSAVETD